MEKDRQTKIIAIVALFIGVATLTIGFSAFSARLIIQSKATVTPDADSFKVLLSKEQTSVVVGKVAPIGNGEEATIDNNDVPTISNLKANFVNPGEKAVYEFYAVNAGDLDAFLNKIDFTNITGKTNNKVCTAGEGTTQSLVDSACNSIRVTVKVAEDDKACQTSTYDTHSLPKGTGEKVVVTIEYNRDGARADGPFEVVFGDITLNYSTVDTETKDVPECIDFSIGESGERPAYDLEIKDRSNIVDNDNDGKISKNDKVTLRADVNDKVTLGTESFYVISTDEVANTVTMLAEWNLNVGNYTVSGNPGMQNSACKGYVSSGTTHCTVAFSSITYWNSETYPVWVYNDNNDIVRNHVNTYVDKLKSSGYSSVAGRLIKHEELVSLGCVSGINCNNAPSWVKNTTYWTGSAYHSAGVWYVQANGNFSGDPSSNNVGEGVRPVITISASEI